MPFRVKFVVRQMGIESLHVTLVTFNEVESCVYGIKN